MESIASPTVAEIDANRSDQRSRARLGVTPLTVTASFALIYLMTPTADYFWDGITFALQIEKVATGEAPVSLLFHQNHLLYNAIGYMIYCGSHAIGLHLRALVLLQVTNAILGSAAIGVFLQIAGRVIRHRYAATVAAIILAFSASWWKLATDANAYVPALLLMLLCMRNLLGPKPRWHVAGAMLAGAMLMHELASLFTLAAIVGVFASEKIGRKTGFAVHMSGLAWLVTVAAYYACAALLHRIVQPWAVVEWAASNPSRFSLSSNPTPGLLTTPGAIAEAFVGHRFSLFRSQAGLIESGVALVAIVSLVAVAAGMARRVKLHRVIEALRELARPKTARLGPLGRVVIAWLAPYLVFRCFFEPQDPYHRLFFMPAIALVIGLMMAGFIRRWAGLAGESSSVGLGAIAAVSLGLFNLAFFILPNMKSSSNKIVHTARLAPAVWNEKTVVYFASHNEADTTFQYFNDRTRWQRLSRARVNSLDREIAAIVGQGGNLWLNKGAVSLVDPNWLKEHALSEEITVDVGYAPARYVQLKP